MPMILSNRSCYCILLQVAVAATIVVVQHNVDAFFLPPPMLSSTPMNYYWSQQQKQQQQQFEFSTTQFLSPSSSSFADRQHTFTTTTTTIESPTTMIQTIRSPQEQDTQEQEQPQKEEEHPHQRPQQRPQIIRPPLPPTTPRLLGKVTKTYVEDISSLTELKFFLEEDERPVIIKFYAKWCKKCQKVGKQLDRLAKEYGDRTIVQPPPEGEQEVFVDGSIRFGQLEYTPESKALITETLGIRGTPTLHLYVGTKLLCNGGSSATKIRNELQQISTLTPQQLCDRVESMDDGILTTIIEEAYYDSPDFLNEEW